MVNVKVKSLFLKMNRTVTVVKWHLEKSYYDVITALLRRQSQQAQENARGRG